MLKLKEKFADRVLMLDFDQLCLDPSPLLLEFAKFINYEEDILKFKTLVKTPNSIGRHKEFGLNDFEEEDAQFVHSVYNQ